MLFVCNRFKGLTIKVPGYGLVAFKGGALETTDKRVIQALKVHPWYGGIILPGTHEEPEPEPAPSITVGPVSTASFGGRKG